MEKDPLFLVRMEEVPRSGIDRKGSLDAEWLAPRVGPTHRPTEKDTNVRVQARALGDKLEVDVRLDAIVEFDCSRCAEVDKKALKLDARGLFIPEGRHRHMLEEVSMDEDRMDNTFPYEGNVVDLEALFTDLVALSLEEFPVCSESCKGLCPQCGANLNTGPCQCRTKKIDPRWQALAGLKEKLENKAGDK